MRKSEIKQNTENLKVDLICLIKKALEGRTLGVSAVHIPITEKACPAR